MARWWTPERHNAVVRLLAKGYTAAAVANEIGNTRNAIIGHARRTGIPLNNTKAGCPKGTKHKPHRIKLKLMVETKIIPVKPLPPAPEGGVAIMDLKYFHCRYPLWNDPAPDIKHKRFCGRQHVEGKRWCAEHLAVITRP